MKNSICDLIRLFWHHLVKYYSRYSWFTTLHIEIMIEKSKSSRLTPIIWPAPVTAIPGFALYWESPSTGMMQYAGREAYPLNRNRGYAEQYVWKKKKKIFFSYDPVDRCPSVCPTFPKFQELTKPTLENSKKLVPHPVVDVRDKPYV